MILVKKFFRNILQTIQGLGRVPEHLCRPSGPRSNSHLTQDLRPGLMYSTATGLALQIPLYLAHPFIVFTRTLDAPSEGYVRNDGFSGTCDESSEASSTGDPRIAHHIGLFASFCLALRALGVCFPTSSGVGLSEDLE